MCGIAGAVRLADPRRGGVPPLEPSTARAMADRLVHRGPEGRGAWTAPSGRCVLGHTRLRVIDLETGDQPMGNEDGTVQVVFNGEIYNFRELRAELEAAGHRFRTTSDTEVIVHGWEAWGEALPERLDGMFAFAVWDDGRGRLLLARDRPGKKPLYLARTGGRDGDAPTLAFASEIGALLAAPGVDAALDPGAFPRYLAYGYVPAPRTFHRGVFQLPPAHALTVDAADPATWPAADAPTATARRYWSLDWSPRPVPFDEAKAEVRRRVTAAVERRLVADVPLGAFLSGGVDSTVIVGVMAGLSEEPVRTFSMGFADDPSYDETRFARIAAARFGTRHSEFTVHADEVELIDTLVAAYDEPFGDSSAIPTWLVSRMTREHVTVALTGDGGDEVFGGYYRFIAAALAEKVPGRLVRAAGAVSRILPHHPDFRHPTRRLTRFLEAAALSPEERTLRWIGYVPGHAASLLRPEVLEAAGMADLGDDPGTPGRAALLEPYTRALREAAADATPLGRQQALNFETYLPADLLVKADRCSMDHALELRSPFLDTALVEYVAGLPDRHRIRRGRRKHILLEAFDDILPSRIVRRPKMGFGVPLPLWFRTRWKGFFETRVMRPDAPLWRWLRRDAVEELWREHQAHSHDHAHGLWAIMTLAVWLEQRGGDF